MGIWMTGRLEEWPTIVMVPSDDDEDVYNVKVFTLGMEWKFSAHADYVLGFIAEERLVWPGGAPRWRLAPFIWSAFWWRFLCSSPASTNEMPPMR